MRPGLSSPTLRRPLPRMLAGGVIAATSAGAIVALIRLPIGGAQAALSAVAGTALVVLFFVIGTLGLAAVLGGKDPVAAASMSLMGAFTVYLGQLVLATAAVLVISGWSWLDRPSVTFAGLASVVAWQVGQVAGFSTARILVHTPATA